MLTDFGLEAQRMSQQNLRRIAEISADIKKSQRHELELMCDALGVEMTAQTDDELRGALLNLLH